MNTRPLARRRTSTLWLLLSVLLGLYASLPAATLLKYNFEGTNTWTGMAGYFQSAGGTGTSTPTVTTVGTVNTYGATSNLYTDNVASNGVKLVVNSSAATGNWTAGVDSGVQTLLTSNAITNLGLITLSFSLWSSNANPILVRIESYDPTTNLRTGGLKTLIYPAAPNFYQRFAIDLSKMTADGTGSFAPGNSKVRLYFEIGNALGGEAWPNASASELHIDNVNYSTPKYFVKPSTPGSDNNNGLTETTPWQTISKGVNAAVAGDIIILMGSETDQFAATGTSGLVAFKTQRGTPEAWIVLKNYPGQTPILRSSGWNTISIGNGYNGSRYTGTSVPAYIEVRGLTVRGYSSVDANGDRGLPDALKPYLGLVDSRTNNNGIGIDGRYNDYVMHDLRIADNVIEYCTAAGIGAGETDRLTIENNITRYNTWWSIYGGSGISAGPAIATEVNNDTRMLIQNNQSYGNEGMIPWRSINAFSDGNGIIVDTNQISKSDNPFGFPDFTGRTLVQNNLCYNNGGSGIHSFQSAHVDIIHNVAYRNSASPRLTYSQIFAGYSADVRMIDNILVAPSNPSGSTTFNEPITSNSYNTAGTIYYQNNVFFGEGNNQAIPTNTNFTNNTTTDPLFLSPSIDPATNDFHLRTTSPALNNGLAITYRSALDFALRPRLLTNLTPDRGAYQSQATDAKAPVFTPQPGNFTAAQSVTLASDTASAKIVYTTNGTIPALDAAGNATNGAVYSAAIPVSAAATLKAITWKSGLTTSYVSTANYTFVTTQATIPTPVFDVAPTATNGTQWVSIIPSTPGALVRYTLDGTTPTSTSGTIAGAAAIPVTAGNIIKAIAYKTGRTTSAVLSGNFVVRPELGSLAEGTTTTDAIGANKIRFARFHPATDMTVTKIYAKVGAISGSYRTAIYADTGGVPGALLKASSAAVTGPTAGWQGFALASSLSLADTDSKGNALYYWLAIWSNDAAATVYATTTGGTLTETASTFGATWPATAPTTTAATNAAYNYSIFATTSYQPVVSAGSGQTLASVSSTATLTGTATDNSTPAVPLPASFLTTAWTKVSGPGTVTFATPAALSTTATFSAAGTYVLRLTGQDTLFTLFAPVTSDVTITVPGAATGTATATAVTSGTNVATLGNALTFTANVTSTGGIPAGTVTFYDGTMSLGTGTLDGTGAATLTTSALSVGIHSITASYGGNASYAASTSSGYSQKIILLDGTTRLVAINSAGPAISGSGFVADTGFTSGAAASTTATISTSAVTYPAPAALYQVERYATSFSYSLTGFTPSTAYLVRLHFCENWWGTSTRVNQTTGQRFINVSINGVQRLNAFDIWAAAGASNKAVIREFSVAADSSGVITINFAGITGSADPNALVDGLEVYTVTPVNAWRVNYFTAAQLDDASFSGLLADSDKDGISNLMEYALGSDPLTADTTNLPTVGYDEDGHLTLTFQRARSDVTYFVEGSGDLLNWTVIATNPGSVGQAVTVPDNASLDSNPRFLRLRVAY